MMKALLLYVLLIDVASANCKAKITTTCCNVCQNGNLLNGDTTTYTSSEGKDVSCSELAFSVGDVDTDDPIQRGWCMQNQVVASKSCLCDYNNDGQITGEDEIDLGDVTDLNGACNICQFSTNKEVSKERKEADANNRGRTIQVEGTSSSCTAWEQAGAFKVLSRDKCAAVTLAAGSYCCDNGPHPDDPTETPPPPPPPPSEWVECADEGSVCSECAGTIRMSTKPGALSRPKISTVVQESKSWFACSKRNFGGEFAFGVDKICECKADIYVKCADEGETCSCDGKVRFTANGRLGNVKKVSGSVTCNTRTFGSIPGMRRGSGACECATGGADTSIPTRGGGARGWSPLGFFIYDGVSSQFASEATDPTTDPTSDSPATVVAIAGGAGALVLVVGAAVVLATRRRNASALEGPVVNAATRGIELQVASHSTDSTDTSTKGNHLSAA